MDILDLSEFFKTKAESINFSTRLRSISEKLFTNNFNLDTSLSNEFGLEKKDKFINFLINNKVNINSKSDLGDFFTKVIEKISSLPVLTIVLAYEPDAKTLEIMSEWINLNIKKQFLFDFSINPMLIAGAEILTNGKHSNSSIRAKLDQVIKDELDNYFKISQANLGNVEKSNIHAAQNLSQTPLKSQ